MSSGTASNIREQFPVPPDEGRRLDELRELKILDTPPEADYDDLVRLASHICGTPIALMTLLDADRQWFKSRTGLAAKETPRDQAFCAHAILEPDDLMVVNDATKDRRFVNNPLVTSNPNIRFYAGAPLVTPRGHAMGTLCVIDQVPRNLSAQQADALRALGRQVVVLLELRRAKEAAEQATTEKSAALEKLSAEQERSERLLKSIFPDVIAERLKTSSSPYIADHFDDVTILFADLQGYWRLVGPKQPTEIIEVLNRVFSLFDRLADRHGVEKIKTIGDAYMAVAGLTRKHDEPAAAAAEMALAMQREIVSLDTGLRDPISLRIGLNTGPAVAGVIGTSKLAYDLWGPTVNLASQMETFGVSGGIQVTAATYERLKNDYIFEPRGEFYIKGQGDVSTFLLKGRKLG